MKKEDKLRKDIELSARIDKNLEDFMKTYAAAKGVKYMKGRIIVELAELARKMILKESEEYKEKIKSMVENRKDKKLENALKLIEALKKEGLALREEKGNNEA